MKFRLIYATCALVLLLAVELLFAPDMRPELLFGLCVYSAFVLPSGESLYLFLVGGFLKDSLSVERFGLFMAIAAALFLLSSAFSRIFTPNLFVLCVAYALSAVLLRLLYASHVFLSGYSPEGILRLEVMLPALSRGVALLIPLYLLLEEGRKERRRRELYSEGRFG